MSNLMMMVSIMSINMFLLLILILSAFNQNKPSNKLMFLIIFTITMSIYIGVWTPNFFFSFIMFMMIIGGVMVIFGYFVSTIGETILLTKINWSRFSISLLMILSLVMFITYLNFFDTEFLPSYLLEYKNFKKTFEFFPFPFHKSIYSSHFWFMIFISISSLSITMIIVMKMISSQNKAIRVMKNKI